MLGNSGVDRSFVSALSKNERAGLGCGESEFGDSDRNFEEDEISDLNEFSFGIDEEDLGLTGKFVGEVGREQQTFCADDTELERKRLNDSIFVEFRDYQKKNKVGEVRTRIPSIASPISSPNHSNNKKTGGKLCFGSKSGDSTHDGRKSVESRLDNSSCDLEPHLHEDQ